jgi:hypothetical protein
MPGLKILTYGNSLLCENYRTLVTDCFLSKEKKLYFWKGRKKGIKALPFLIFPKERNLWAHWL